MSNDINAAGYELKPWWPYVRELMSNQVTVESVTILENGVYTAPAGKAYSPVTVNVPTYDVDSLSVTENGTYTPETGNAYNSVSVNVPQTQLSSLSVTENGTYTPEAGNAYNSVTVNVPSDFYEAEVTVTNNTSSSVFQVIPSTLESNENVIAIKWGLNGITFPENGSYDYAADTETTDTYYIHNGGYIAGFSQSISGAGRYTVTGDAEVLTIEGMPVVKITGDCTITISAS